MQRQHSSQATSTLGNTPNLNIGFLHQKENPTYANSSTRTPLILCVIALNITISAPGCDMGGK